MLLPLLLRLSPLLSKHARTSDGGLDRRAGAQTVLIDADINAPGKRSQTVWGAKGDETSGGEDDDDDIQMRAHT